MEQVVRVEGLRKAYGDTVAVDDVSFAVTSGEIFGIVGPNGAGKTTAVECLIGLRRPDAGEITVLGLDPLKAGAELRQRLGIQLQQAALPDRIKVWEALDLFAAFYQHPAPWPPLLAEWGLAEKRNAFVGNLSGGQKQRLFIALALVNDPELVILDELTSGLDPRARRATWDLVRAVRNRGVTVLLVSHAMDEVQRLCDRVAIFDHGRIVALDSPAALIASATREQRVRFRVVNGFEPEGLRATPGVRRVDRDGDEVIVAGDGPLMAAVATALAAHGLAPSDLRTESATLDDVFLSLTGRTLRD